MKTVTCMTPAAFSALPMRQKAIMVATDVIAQLKTKNIKTMRGAYIEYFNISSFDFEISTASEVGRHVIQNAKCTVCAKGAIFLSAIQRSNEMNLGDVRTVSRVGQLSGSWDGVENNPANIQITKKITEVDRIFTRDNFDMIEAAFERDGCFAIFSHIDTRNACADFGFRYDNSDIRLVAICMNIIKNGGVFDPVKYKPKLSDVGRKLFGRKYKVSAL